MIKKYLPFITLLIILVVAAYLRLYRIGDYMSFLGDEGRDVLVVKRMIVDGKITLLGPVTSVGLMHLGPMYYYFMVPFLILTRLDPVGPAIMVALFSLATIVLLWQLAREYFDIKVATIAALLYGLSPLVITYSHSSWNPNILPFWSLFIIYSLLKYSLSRKWQWLFVVGLSLGVVFQLHYIAFIFIPIIALSLFLDQRKLNLRNYVVIGCGWFVTFLPFILFEIRHGFINVQTVFEFVTRTGGKSTFALASFFHNIWDLLVRLFWRLIVVVNAEAAIVMMLVVIITSIWLVWHNKLSALSQKALMHLLVWLVVGVGIISFYTGVIYDYYLMSLFPLPFLLFAIVLVYFSKKVPAKMVALLIVIILCIIHLWHTPISKEPNRLAFQAKEIASFVLEKAQGKPYNFAMIAGMNSDHAYRYFLETIDANPPIVIENDVQDPQKKTVTDQLFVVCEEKVCQPEGHPLWEIAGFGRSQVQEEWRVGLFRVFKLIHFNGTISQ